MILSIGESRMKAKPVQNFPEEIIEDILLRLPVRSLLILKCVCKSWHALISSKHFIQTHLRISKEHTNLDRRRMVFEVLSESAMDEYQTRIKHCSFLPILSGAEAEAVDCGIPMEISDFAYIIGDCNGLICVLVYHKFICLCNPSTREIKKSPDLDCDIVGRLSINMIGFGFDEATEDYKVVCVITAEDLRHIYSVAKVYSLKSNSWRPIEILKEYVTENAVDKGVFVSQKLHWSRRIGDSNRYELVSFDLSNEVWEKTEIPEFYGPQGFRSCLLLVFGGCLSALCKSPESRALEVDLWVLKESGNSQSWEKLFHMPYFRNPLLEFDPGDVQLADGPNSTIVLLDCMRMDLVTDDLKDHSFSQLYRKNTYSIFPPHIFIESLVQLT